MPVGRGGAPRVRRVLAGRGLVGVDRLAAEVALRLVLGRVGAVARLDVVGPGLALSDVRHDSLLVWVRRAIIRVPRDAARVPAGDPDCRRVATPGAGGRGQAGSASSRARNRASDAGSASPIRRSASRPMKPRNGGVLTVTSSEIRVVSGLFAASCTRTSKPTGPPLPVISRSSGAR